MDVWEELISGKYFNVYSLIIMVILVTYNVAHMIYDILSKTDIEKSITYRGKDRIYTNILVFMIFIVMTLIVSLDEFIKISKDDNLIVAILVVLMISMIFYIASIMILGLIHLFFVLKKFYPKFEVEIKENNEKEYWEILKVTKENRVILKNEDKYLVLSNVDKLEGKLIRVIKIKK